MTWDLHVHIEFDTTMTGVDKNYKSIGSFRPIKHRIFAILFFTTRLDTVQIRQYSPKFVFERSTSVVIFYCRSLRGLTIIIIIIIIYFNRIIFTVVFANEKWLNDATCRFFFFFWLSWIYHCRNKRRLSECVYINLHNIRETEIVNEFGCLYVFFRNFFFCFSCARI